jgi:hypothetical protein
VTPFESAWLKWGMAVLNAYVLEANINEWVHHPERQRPPFAVAQHYDPKRHCILFEAGPFENPFPVMWSLLLGDVVHGYRCALDHVAWALYKRGKTPALPPKAERQIYFPIAWERDWFNKVLPVKLPGVRRADVAIVRRYQPYIHGKRNAPFHVFKILEDLSNADKHRAIQPVFPVPEGGSYRLLSEPHDCSITRVGPPIKRVTLKEGADLGRLYVRKTGPDPYVEVEPKFTLDPSINERLTVGDWARAANRITGLLLRELAEPPESVRVMLAPLGDKEPRALSLEGPLPT